MSGVDIGEAKKFFFEAMVNGWAAGAKKIALSDMPGYKGIFFQDGDFRLLDCYCVGLEGSRSAGTTTIWHCDVPVWFMSFGGSYEKEAIPFLKHALLKAYKTRQFVGGRGPLLYVEDPLVYVNWPRLNDFAKFEGREEILNAMYGIPLGFHDYWGMRLM